MCVYCSVILLVSNLEFNIKTSIGLRWADSKSLKGHKLDTNMAYLYQFIKSTYNIHNIIIIYSKAAAPSCERKTTEVYVMMTEMLSPSPV